jgi:hypothetical protein
MSEVHKLIDEIRDLPIQPKVFEVLMMASDHRAGFSAWVEFRHGHGSSGYLSRFEAHADTPEEALKTLRDNLTAALGPCPVCGRTGPKEIK